jgi:hypothetical protein
MLGMTAGGRAVEIDGVGFLAALGMTAVAIRLVFVKSDVVKGRLPVRSG